MQSQQQSPPQLVRPQAWEKSLAWLILILSPLGYVGIAIAAAANPQAFREAFESGGVSWYSLLIPLPRCIGAVLLVRMSKWSYSFLIGHLLVAIGSLFLPQGAEAMSTAGIASFGVQALAVVFCSYLLRTGKLR